MKNEIKCGRSLRLSNIIIQDVNAPIIRGCQLRCLLAIATKPGIIKIILHGVLDGSSREPLLVLIYINDLDSKISNAIGVKATLFAYEITIFITDRHSLDLIFNIDRIVEIPCPGFIKTD